MCESKLFASYDCLDVFLQVQMRIIDYKRPKKIIGVECFLETKVSSHTEFIVEFQIAQFQMGFLVDSYSVR